MTSYYTLRVSRSDITVPGKSKAPYLYVKVSFGDESCRTRSINELPPQYNETFPITCSGNETRLTIKLIKEALLDSSMGSRECSLEEILSESGEDVRISLQSKSGSQTVFLCLQPSDKMKNAELTLVNLAHTLLGIHPSSDSNFAEKVNTIFDTAKRVAESKIFQSLVEVGYTITAFVELGNSIAEASPYLKLTWCITAAFLNVIATQINTDKRVGDLVQNLMGLFLVIKDTSIFNNPSDSLRLIITNLLELIIQCGILLQEYARKSLLVRSVLHNKNAVINDLETTLARLKTDLISTFERQGIIEAQIRAKRTELEKKLRPKHEIGHNRQTCLEGTRVEVLEEIEDWIQDANAPNVLMILGRAGTGKSTIATTIAENYQRKGQLGSHQYFLRDKSDPAFIFRTIAYDLASRCHKTANAIDIQLDANEITCATPERAFEILLFDPLHAITEEGKKEDNILIVLDALDECGSREAREPYIRLIKEKLQTLPLCYRFLVTSRPEEDIASSEELKQLEIRHINLDHESDNAKGDVLKYIQTKLCDLKVKGRLIVDPSWPWDESVKALGDAAGGLFIWAATAIRLIESKKQNKAGELIRLVNTKSLSLDNLYTTALENSFDWDDAMKIDFPKVFSLILFGKEQLSITSIDTLLGLDNGETQSILECLRSLVAFEPNQPVRLFHTSLYDYLISEEACGRAWFIDEEREKANISQRCFNMMEILRFNICDLETSYKMNKDVLGLDKRIKDNISASLLYACRHWASHLVEAPYSEDLLERIETFAFERLLYWIETLSLTDSLDASVLLSLNNAITWIGDKHVQLSAFLQDAHDQLLTFIEPISQSIPHLYMSFLPLMKGDSIVAEHYAKQARSLSRVEYVGNKPQMACTKQLNVGHPVLSISYHPDGSRIASGSNAGVIEVWDVVSGRLSLGPLCGHSRSVTGVAYSADGKYIASGSEDQTVRTWNAVTGEGVLGPLVGHSEEITSVTFTRNGKYIASGSNDETVGLWDAESGEPVIEPLWMHLKEVKSVIFSPNGRYLVSGSTDDFIAVWDVQSRKIASYLFRGSTDTVTSLSFSPDSRKIVAGSGDGTICVWKVSTGKALRTYTEDDMGWVFSVAYSSDGKHILSGSLDKIVRMWDAEDSSALPKRFEGHTDSVLSVVFAPDSKHFASGSSDGTIRVWDVEEGVTDSGFKGQTEAIRAIAISPKTGKFLVSGSKDKTVCIWNTEGGELIKGPLKGHSNWVTSVAFSSNEIHFASGSMDKSIRIWNMIDDGSITCNGHTGWVLSIAFSPDGSHLASGSEDNSIRIWDIESGALVEEPFIGHSSWVCSVCYSPDGRKIVSGSIDKTVRIWNSSGGSLFLILEGHSHSVRTVAYSHDGLYIVSGSDDKTIRVWYAETGRAAFGPITGHRDRINSVCFSLDGKRIISGSWDKTICVWDASTGGLFFQSRVLSEVNSIADFPTSDSKHIKIASGSKDGTIHIWSISSDSEGRKCYLEDNGWLTGNNGNLLIWIPPDLRQSLVYGPRTINTRFSTSLDSSIYRDEQWNDCFPSNNGTL